MANFAERLRLLREEHHLSQMALGQILGISKSSVNMYERGEREPGLDMVERIADYFNVDIAYLLGKSEHPNIVRETARGEFDDDDLRFALFGGDARVITDEMLDEVKRFAKFIAAKEKDKQNEGEDS